MTFRLFGLVMSSFIDFSNTDDNNPKISPHTIIPFGVWRGNILDGEHLPLPPMRIRNLKRTNLLSKRV